MNGEAHQYQRRRLGHIAKWLLFNLSVKSHCFSKVQTLTMPDSLLVQSSELHVKLARMKYAQWQL